MRALTWHGKRDVRVSDVPEPTIEEPTDAVVRITSTATCGSDLHLYEVLGMFMDQGDVLGHEPLGIVEAVGDAVEHISPGDRVVVPFNISCGACWMCRTGLYSQCETTQVRSHDKGAALFGYTRLYGSVPGGQAELLRVPHADFGPVKIPADVSDERMLYLSDILPTAWQAVEYAEIPEGGSVAVFGLGPVGQFCCRVALQRGAGTVFGVDPVPERRTLAQAHGAVAIDGSDMDAAVREIRERTEGRGTDSTIDAVGLEAHGSPIASAMQTATGLLPDRVAAGLVERAGVDRMAALHASIETARRGGTVSISGVYGGALDPMPMMTMFDKGLRIHMGQANVRRWTDTIMPLLLDDADPLGVEGFATHHLPLDAGPEAYEMFQKKHDGAIKVVLHP